jgi:hypothetical protein
MKKNFYHMLMLLLLSGCADMLLSKTAAGQSADKSDRLKPYTSCKFDSDLYVKEVTQRDNSGENYRTVKTPAGEKRVSVIGGYRVMFAYKKARYYFANVKVEQSNAQDFAKDKDAVVEEIKYLPAYENVSAKMVYRGKLTFNGYEVYGADKDVIDEGGVIGIYAIFADADNVIITAYFLNQGRENRRFNNIEEFRVLRDDFLTRYSGCIKNALNR